MRCALSESNHMEGTLYRCPDKYIYWGKSRRCERAAKIPECKSTVPSSLRHGIPVEWINLGKNRSLRIQNS